MQYQFDGNANLIYTIIRKRTVFHNLANLPTDHCSIQRSLNTTNPPGSGHIKRLSRTASIHQSTNHNNNSNNNRTTQNHQNRKLTRPLSLVESNSPAYTNTELNMPKTNPNSPGTPQSTGRNFLNYDIHKGFIYLVSFYRKIRRES